MALILKRDSLLSNRKLMKVVVQWFAYKKLSACILIIGSLGSFVLDVLTILHMCLRLVHQLVWLLFGILLF